MNIAKFLRNVFFYRTPPVAASVSKRLVNFLYSPCFAKSDRFKRFKVACRVQILKKKKHLVKIVTSLVTVLLKMTLGLCIHFEFVKQNIILSLFKIDKASPCIF